jgi:type IV pilus assembly protein PilB
MVTFSSEEKQKDKLKEMREQEAEDLAMILSKKYKTPYLNLTTATVDLDALSLLPEETARKAKMAVFQKNGKKLEVAVLNPGLDITVNILRELEEKGYNPEIFMVSEISLEKTWKKYGEVPAFLETSAGIIDVSTEKMEQITNEVKTLDDLKNIFSSAAGPQKGKRTSEILEILLAGAISVDASDIHIEPQENQIRLRYRLDGVLNDIFMFNPKTYNLLLSRIKLISGLKLNIRDQAQDGRLSVHLKDVEIEIRISVIPGSYGESIVMRILNPKSISVPLEELGIEKNLYDILMKEIAKPNGMIINTGPTGSGKTTTLYAFLKKIYSPEIKIITLEDPVEYHLKGISQTQIEEDKGYGFADGLRAILRQDPDVIMVGEIRDLETAKIAINAALTGHLVFSTLHTNNAAGTIPRLVDLGVNPNIIAPAINVAMAQRLMRKLCDACKEKSVPTPEEKVKIEKWAGAGEFSVWRSKGCPKCNNLGYKGRIGVFEAVIVDSKMEELILKMPGETEIAKESEGQGILNMQQDGILKVIKGVTSLDELERVIEL